METKVNLSAAGLEVLVEDNYMDWSIRVETYLIAQDLWEIIEATTEPPKQEDDELAFKAWRKKNYNALHVIQTSCGPYAFSVIKQIRSAKIAWDTLAKMHKYNAPANTNSGSDNSANNYVEHMAVYKALQSGDWNAVKEFLQLHPYAVSARIAILGKTALHVAVAAGHVHIVEELVELMSEESLEIQDDSGFTALTETTLNGNYRMAECMVRKNKRLVSIADGRKELPVVRAIAFGHVELARYLYSLTPLEDLMPEKGISGATLFTQAIYTRALDIALDIMQRCPRLGLAVDKENWSPVYALASMPYAFPSTNPLVFWKQWIYSCIPIRSVSDNNEIRLNIHKVEKRQSNQVTSIGSVLALLRHLVSNLLKLLGIKDLYEMKLVHVQSLELLRRMSEEVSISNYQQRRHGQIYPAIFRAIKEGIFEFVFDLVRANPDLVWSNDNESRGIFSYAVLYRQPKIFSLIYRLDVKNAMTYFRDLSLNNILHMAGMPAASTLLNQIPGSALQMQRELQWFKEVESIVHPKVKEVTNRDGLTPRELFTKNHKDMMINGEQWMKDTATSCTVVGALIATIMFAAVFTVPGGNNQDTGFPIFLDKRVFMLFIISDALSLFSSSTSVLMFMGILTSRYAEDDFLESLPRKMIIGLSTLFFSIATMMITFSTALLIILQRQSWIVIPVICLASVPVTLFVLMQFPLLVGMFNSTYRPGIFDRKMKRWF